MLLQLFLGCTLPPTEPPGSKAALSALSDASMAPSRNSVKGSGSSEHQKRQRSWRSCDPNLSPRQSPHCTVGIAPQCRGAAPRDGIAEGVVKDGRVKGSSSALAWPSWACAIHKHSGMEGLGTVVRLFTDR